MLVDSAVEEVSIVVCVLNEETAVEGALVGVDPSAAEVRLAEVMCSAVQTPVQPQTALTLPQGRPWLRPQDQLVAILCS